MYNWASIEFYFGIAILVDSVVPNLTISTLLMVKMMLLLLTLLC